MGILIVDDSENTRSLLEFYLKGAGYEDVFHAETAPEAFSLLKTNDTSKIDLDTDGYLFAGYQWYRGVSSHKDHGSS